jgi:hypothetical protein
LCSAPWPVTKGEIVQWLIFIVAPCILKIHSVLHTHECTNYILYTSLQFVTFKHLKCCYMFRSSDSTCCTLLKFTC